MRAHHTSASFMIWHVRRSSERILTTHVGSLIRPPELLDAMRARDRDPARWNAAVSTAVRDVVQRQRDAGIDIVDDGEYSKTGFTAYVTDRLEGFEFRPPPPGQSAMLNRGRDRRAFADFYREYDATEGQTEGGMTAVCVGPIAYRGREVLERDFANLRAAMREAGADEAFIPAAAPGTIELQRTNAYYPSEETYLFAIADAMRTEYQAIVEAGFILQLDDPRVVVQWDLQDPAPTVAEYRAFAELRIAALNRAIAGLPEDRMRYHLCWGSWHGPHTTDIPLADIVDLVLRVRAAMAVANRDNVVDSRHIAGFFAVDAAAGRPGGSSRCTPMRGGPFKTTRSYSHGGRGSWRPRSRTSVPRVQRHHAEPGEQDHKLCDPSDERQRLQRDDDDRAESELERRLPLTELGRP